MDERWIVTKLPSGRSQLPTSLIVARGSIFFTDSIDTNKIFKTNLNNSSTEIIVHIQGAVLREMAYDGNNTIYFANSQQNKIMSFDMESGNVSIVAGSGIEGHKDGNALESSFHRPLGITVDGNNLLVTDRHHIRNINLIERTVSTIAGCTTGTGRGAFQNGDVSISKFDNPAGVAVGSDDTIYVADYANRCIRKIKDGIVSTAAGIPGVDGVRNGPLDDSVFTQPMSVHLLSQHVLLVSEYGRPLRRIDLKHNWVSYLNISGSFRGLYVTPDRTLYFGRPYDAFYKAEPVWNWERYLWIGFLKENSSWCYLAMLPREIIEEIASYLGPPLDKGNREKRKRE